MISTRSLPFAYLSAVFFLSLGLVDPCLGDFNAQTAFAWVDSSCNSVIDQVNAAGSEYNTLVGAAITSLDGGTPSTELGKGTLFAYFGTDVGALINAKYTKLQSAFADPAATRPKALELYCDGTAFEWVTTYQEGPKQGQPLPGSGQWHAKEGRYNTAVGPLYLSGTKTDQRTSICQDPTGKNAEGVSAVGGTHVILCPDAFKNPPILGAVPTTQQTIGTSLDTMTSTGAILLHEVTHCILSTKDILYKVSGVLMTAKISSNAQKNADTWMYYAMASRANQNAWVIGLAQALDDWGPKAPKAPPSKNKRDTLPLDAPKPRAFADNDPRSPKLDVRQNAATVTVTVTFTQSCPVVSAGNSASGKSASTGSTINGSRSAGSASKGSHTAKGRSTASNSAGSTGSGTGKTTSLSKRGSSTISGSAGTVFSISGGSAPSNPGGTRGSNSKSASGFTTLVSNTGTGADAGSSHTSGKSAAPGSGGGGGASTTTAGYVGPVPLPTYPASVVSANTAGLTTHTSTTTPVYIEISSSVSSNGHTQKTNGVGPFPIFWSHTCWFCPPGLCLSCGAQLDLDPGIYPPGSINPPPGWKGPLPTITIGNDGTPSYDEDEPQETNKQPSNTGKSQSSTAPKTNTGSSTVPSSKSATSSSANSGVNYIFETPEIYSEVSDTIPFSSVSALVASEFAANSIDGYSGATSATGSASNTATSANPSSSHKAGPASTTFSSASAGAVAPTTTPKPSSTTATAAAFSCTSVSKPLDPDYPCLCNGEWDYISMPSGGCGWTTAPAAENSCENCE